MSGHFRHAFDANEDPKLQWVIDNMGFEGYGLYFSLLEICAKEYYKTKDCRVKFHIQSLRKLWRKQTESCKKVLTKLEQSGLFVVTFSEHLVICHIANLPKYVGIYPPQKERKVKGKEKEIKEANTIADTNHENIQAGQTNSTDLAPAEAVAPEKKLKASRTAQEKAEAAEVRDAYSKKYRERYGIAPTFAAAENKLVYTLISRVGIIEAIGLAESYPNYPDPWHVNHKHPFMFLVKHLDKIRVETFNPARMLDGQIAQTELKTVAEKAKWEHRKRDLEQKIEAERHALAIGEGHDEE